MITLPHLVTRSPQPYVFIARTLAMKDLNGAMRHAFAELRRWCERSHADPAGPPFVRYAVVDMPDALQVEFALPSATPSSDAGTLERGLLPAGEYAQIGFKGHFQHLVDVNAMLIGWARFKGIDLDMKRAPAGDEFASRIEIYKTNPDREPDPRRWESEFLIKVGRRAPLRSNGEAGRRIVNGNHGGPPTGWHSVTPRLVARDAAGLIGFLAHVFDARGKLEGDRPAIVQIGDSVLMVSEADARPTIGAFLYVYVGDCDAAFRRAHLAGARIVEEPFDTPYGDRRGMVEDGWGNTWQIATRKATGEVSP